MSINTQGVRRGAYLLVRLTRQELGLGRIRVGLQKVGTVGDAAVVMLGEVFVVLLNPVPHVTVALEVLVEVVGIQPCPVKVLPVPGELCDAFLRLDRAVNDVLHVPRSLAAATSPAVRPYLLFDHGVESIAQVVGVFGLQSYPDEFIGHTMRY